MTTTQIERQLTNKKISMQILVLVARGKKLPEAIDTVLGEGTYAQIANDTFDALRGIA